MTAPPLSPAERAVTPATHEEHVLMVEGRGYCWDASRLRWRRHNDWTPECIDADQAPDLVTCQGCGAVRGGSWLGKAHGCWRNEDGTYEEGGTFQ